MDKSSIASAIFAAYPQNFKEQIAGVDVSELSVHVFICFCVMFSETRITE